MTSTNFLWLIAHISIMNGKTINKKVMLINPPGYKPIKGLGLNSPNPPIGLAYIAGTLEVENIEYSVIDMTGEALNNVTLLKGKKDIWVLGLENKDVITRIRSDIDIIAISCMFSMHWPLVRDLIKEIKIKYPDIVIVAGGEHISALPEFCLQTSGLNIAILGEGEEIFPNLIRAIRENKDLNDIKGIVFKKNNKVTVNEKQPRIKSLESIAWPSWKKIPITNYIDSNMQNGVNRGRSMPIVATRGCPFKCTFCSNSQMWGPHHFVREPLDVVKEMKSYINKYQVTNFNFQDLTAFVKKKWVLDLCEEINKNDLNITWQLPSGTRIESFDESVAMSIRKSGCRNIAFAPESASAEILKDTKKNINLDKLLDACKIAVDNDINLSCFFVVGLPLETERTLEETLKFIRKLAKIGVTDIGMSKFVPYPGSKLFDQFLKEGIITLDDSFFLSSLDFYTSASASYTRHLTAKELGKWQVKLLTNFYLISAFYHPIRTLQNVFKAIFLRSEETRYSKMITDILYHRSKIFLQSFRKLEHKNG